AMLEEHEESWLQALQEDLGKCACEGRLTETGFVKGEIRHMLRHMERWLKPRKASMPLSLFPGRAKLVHEPKGVVLIMAPWNYPLMLILSPLVGALAAGNAVLLKPSELASQTSALLARLVPRYLDHDAVRVLEADAEGTGLILKERFDHIFYTGNPHVAKIVMAAAAEYLTPVTLELGGKSPAWVDEYVDMDAVARRLAWAKFLNAGQTCVAPDYVLTTRSAAQKLAEALQRAVENMYGKDVQNSKHYGRIINDRHVQRLKMLLKDVDEDQIAFGSHIDEDQRYAAPTVLNGVRADQAVMKEEIFGPILPIVHVEDASAAIDFINCRPKPLALYVFSSKKDIRKRFEEETSSGALCHHFAVAHLGAKSLPFGGVGESGMGRYMGRYSLETFSHQKPVFGKPLGWDTLRFVSAPYGRLTDWVIRFFI
ncbi:MAG: aldehyde dehydrogenase family protein, partial [Eubacteriales bacterium]|nr:aldehyde dehydrogenase family protein [Eubacteriales bacterium]